MSSSPRKIALITGANKGLGLETARQIGQTGALVLVACRNAEAGAAAVQTLTGEGLQAQFVALDLTSQATIDAAAKQIEADHGHLDIFVNNAGVVVPGDGPPSSGSLAAIESTFRTNFFGPLAVTQAMLPLLRKAPSARIVNVSSGLGSLTQNADPAWPYAAVKYLGYNGSKAALNMMTVQLAYELRDTRIKVNASDPGYTATDLNQNRGTQTIPEGCVATVRLALLPDDGPTGTYSDANGPVPW